MWTETTLMCFLANVNIMDDAVSISPETCRLLELVTLFRERVDHSCLVLTLGCPRNRCTSHYVLLIAAPIYSKKQEEMK